MLPYDYFLVMLIVKTDQPNTLVVTVSQNSELTNPEYLFSFTHIFSKEQVNFIPTDISTHKSRYDEFYFVEGSGVGEINFPYQGQYLYVIYEQASGSGNLNPALAYNVVENGDAQVFPSSASTMGSQYDIYISNNEDNSNIIFAPDEPNPTANITPSPTPTINFTPTPTPSVTATQTPTVTPTNTTTPTTTPTPSSTPAPANPLNTGALWWIDFTDASTIFYAFNQIYLANDKIAGVPFQVIPAGGGPFYNPTGYLGVSGTAQTNAFQLKNNLGAFGSFTEYTWFGRVYDNVVSQRGGKLLVASDGAPYPGGSPFLVIADFNINPYPPGPVWTFEADTNVGGPATLNENFTFSAWTNIALRYYESGGKVRFEFWENGVEISHIEVNSTAAFPVTDPIFGLMFDGGIDFNTEQFFYDRKLTNGEMLQMFTYLTNKY